MISKEELFKKRNIKTNKKGTLLPKDFCFVHLTTVFCNSLGLDTDDKIRNLFYDFGYMLEGLLETCDGQEGEVNFNCKDSLNKMKGDYKFESSEVLCRKCN